MYADIIYEADQWRSALQDLGRFDFVHTFDYHRANCAIDNAVPCAFVVRDGDGVARCFWPCMRRWIGNTERFDLSCVYGYGGPILNVDGNEKACLQAVFEAMRYSGAVSLFSRMHPLFSIENDDESYSGEIAGKAVAIKITETVDVTRCYRGSHRREIANAQRAGVRAYVDESKDRVEGFVGIYRQAMIDIGAKQYYFFNDEFFRRLFRSTDFQTRVIVAEFEGKIIAAAMFLSCCGIMQYFLSGAFRDWRRLSPAKVIISHAHEIAASEGVEYLMLGGGVGGREDELFKFKTGFSEIVLPFRLMKKKLDEDAYDEFCRIAGSDGSGKFFPAYRA